ncbi:MAG: pyridoxamine 5'-phosphate oxidase [Chloroflexi bacterium]|nr:MAG: pyridoxamine 5'-phosphate oxidase [Chloroflexota bacterium]
MDELRERVLAYLHAHQVMTLATCGPLGVWAAAVFYVNDGFVLYFLSAGHTRHARNMAAVPRVAATIQEDYRDWTGIQGIQLEGEVVMLQGEERDTAVSLYTAKYPFITSTNSQIRAALARVNWYRLTPDKLFFVDNTKGLGHRDEVTELL